MMNKASISGKAKSFSNFIHRYREAAFSLIMLAIFILLFYFTKDIKLLVVNTTVDARFWPKICCAFGGILSVLLFIQSAFSGTMQKKMEKVEKTTASESKMSFFHSDTARTAATFILTILYVAMLNSLGFVVSTVLYLFCLFMLLSEKEGRKVWKLLLIDIVFTVVVYILFRYAFQMMLPIGTIW